MDNEIDKLRAEIDKLRAEVREAWMIGWIAFWMLPFTLILLLLLGLW